MSLDVVMKQGFKDVTCQQFNRAFANALPKTKVTDPPTEFAKVLKSEINKIQTLKISQELDELISSYYECKTNEGRSIAKVFIETKRKELNSAIQYNEYLNGVIDPRD